MKLNEIKPNKANPRVIKDDKFKKLVRSLQSFPEMMQKRPIVVDSDMTILGGNMRYKALVEIYGKNGEIPDEWVTTADGWTDEQKREFIIKDNASYGEWAVAELLDDWSREELDEWGVDVPEWDEENITETEETKEDDFDEEKETVEKRATLGDIWQLGAHRLCCGDSTSTEDVMRLLGDDVADMVFTDPPYGIDYSGGRTQVVGTKEYGKLKNDNLQGEALGNLICNVFKHNKAGADVYICVSPIMQKPFLDYIESQGKQLNAVIVWDKKAPGLGYMAYRRQCEFILFIKGGAFHKGDKSDIDLWRIGRDDATTYVHGTQKPIGVSGRAITNSSKEGDIILDYFGGSGSTLIACEQLGRKCRMMELDPHYCDVIIARWEKLTGKKAIRI